MPLFRVDFPLNVIVTCLCNSVLLPDEQVLSLAMMMASKGTHEYSVTLFSLDTREKKTSGDALSDFWKKSKQKIEVQKCVKILL